MIKICGIIVASITGLMALLSAFQALPVLQYQQQAEAQVIHTQLNANALRIAQIQLGIAQTRYQDLLWQLDKYKTANRTIPQELRSLIALYKQELDRVMRRIDLLNRR